MWRFCMESEKYLKVWVLDFEHRNSPLKWKVKMILEDDKEQQKKYWEKPDWKTVSFGNPEINEWYRGFVKRRDEGMSIEFYDIPDDDTPDAKNSLVDKPSW